MSNPKRLHPIAAVESFIKRLKEMVLPFVFLFFINGDKNSIWEYVPILIMGVILVIFLVMGILGWVRFTYRLEEGELRIENGIFVKKKRYIPFERIQSLNFSEGILQRPFGLVKVKVETAGSSGTEAEAELSAIPKVEAERLQQTIREAKTKNKQMVFSEGEALPIGEEDVNEVVHQMTSRDLLLMALTSGGAGVLISGIAVVLSQFTEYIPYQAIFAQVEGIIRNGVLFVVVLIFLVLLVAWLLSILGVFLVYGKFKVEKSADEIIITRGIIEKKRLSIPLNRIQGIRVSENPLRQWFGFAAVHLDSAGGSVFDKESLNIKLFPFIKKNKIGSLLQVLLPEYNVAVSFQRAPKKSIRRYMMRESWMFVIPTLLLSIIFFPLGTLSLLVFVFSAFWGYLKYRSAGWNIIGNQLSLQYRVVSKHTMLVLKKRIQSFERKQSWLQKRKELNSFSVVTTSGAGPKVGTVYYMNEQDGEKVRVWYSPEERVMNSDSKSVYS
ncbi:PH domain-containing protein [Bacillus sp. 2205SS5-2]|uniref:PH domain-containing protein n=1 Tax=Bacillus sp. 2205SS5-2 TaxID=3109031 RepID=UPI003006F269